VAACCLIGFPIPDIQHETPRGIGKGRLLTQSGNPSSYKAVIEANESGRPAVEKLEPVHPGLLVIVLFAGVTSRRSVYTPCACVTVFARGISEREVILEHLIVDRRRLEGST